MTQITATSSGDRAKPSDRWLELTTELEQMFPKLVEEVEQWAIRKASKELGTACHEGSAYDIAADAIMDFFKELRSLPRRPYSWLGQRITWRVEDVVRKPSRVKTDDEGLGAIAASTNDEGEDADAEMQRRQDVTRALRVLGPDALSLAAWALCDIAGLDETAAAHLLAIDSPHQWLSLIDGARKKTGFEPASSTAPLASLARRVAIRMALRDLGDRDREAVAFSFRMLAGFTLEETATLLEQNTPQACHRLVDQANKRIRESDPKLHERLTNTGEKRGRRSPQKNADVVASSA